MITLSEDFFGENLLANIILKSGGVRGRQFPTQHKEFANKLLCVALNSLSLEVF